MASRPTNKRRTEVITVEGGTARRRRDTLATEEPLEIRLLAGGARRSLAVTMRTPGADFELAAGFLLAEGVIATRDDIRAIAYCVDAELDEEQRYNVVNVALDAPGLPDLAHLERHFLATSACGVCGRASLAALRQRALPPLGHGPRLAPATITALPERLRAAQGLVAATGGLHAAALFTPRGELIELREDVGRHNALDKLIGWALLAGRLPLRDAVVLVSGRASYEIMQKCAAAGVPVVCAVSAPSSLAVDLARAFGMTLIGFLRGQRFNIYAGAERVGGAMIDE